MSDATKSNSSSDSKGEKKVNPNNSQSKNKSTDNKDNIQDGNQVWVSSQKRPPFYGNIALRMLAKHDTVELHGLGNAIAAAVEVSQYIIHTGKADLKKITTSTVQNNATRKPEVVIILSATPKAKETVVDNYEGGDEEEEEN